MITVYFIDCTKHMNKSGGLNAEIKAQISDVFNYHCEEYGKYIFSFDN